MPERLNNEDIRKFLRPTDLLIEVSHCDHKVNLLFKKPFSELPIYNITTEPFIIRNNQVIGKTAIRHAVMIEDDKPFLIECPQCPEGSKPLVLVLTSKVKKAKERTNFSQTSS